MIFRTSNGGQSWTVISPDLSTQDPKYIVPSGGIVGDNLGQFYGEVVFAIAPSPMQKGLIWAGTNDGKIWYTKDAGGALERRDQEYRAACRRWGAVTSIQPSFFDRRHGVRLRRLSPDGQSRSVHLQDHGFRRRRGRKISGGLPKGTAVLRARAWRKIRTRKGCCSRARAMRCSIRSTTAGTGPICKTGLPHAPVSWAVVQKQFHDLVVSTYGRGIYILDDITPLEQMAGKPASVADTQLIPVARSVSHHARRAGVRGLFA